MQLFKMATTMMILLLLTTTTTIVQSHPHHRLSRHLMTTDLSMVILVAEPDAQTTEGPFDEEESDYITSSDMKGAALAGSPGVSADRSGVLDGVPITLTMNMYAIAPENMAVGYEYEGVEVFIWQTDALGVYSAVESLGTEGQKWLRGRQVTDANGVVTFETILPGPYVGRALHYHIRFRLPGESGFAATSQLFIKNSDWEQYRDLGAYLESSSTFLSLENDRIFNNLGDSFQDLLSLSLSGSFSTGVAAEVEFGLLKEDAALLQTGFTETSAPGVSPETGALVTPAPVNLTPVPVATPIQEVEKESDISSTEKLAVGALLLFVTSLLVMWT